MYTPKFWQISWDGIGELVGNWASFSLLFNSCVEAPDKTLISI